MPADDPTSNSPLSGEPNTERREALIKLGKYTAYATPIVLASMSAAKGAPISGAPTPPAPPPGPSPT